MAESCVYREVDGHELLADVHVGPAGTHVPVLLWLHGGGMIFGSRRHLPEWQLRRYLAAGFAVVAVDHRLAPEVGLESVVSDAVGAYGWLIGEGADRFGFDRQRVGLIGHSAGGYLALLAACRTDPAPAAVVSFYGYGSLGGDWTRTPSRHYQDLFDLDEEAASAAVGTRVVSDDDLVPILDGRLGYYLLCRRRGTWLSAVCRDGRESDAGWLSTYEPIRQMTDRFPPTLLLHGDADQDVPVEQSLEVAGLLAGLGVAHQMIRHRDWGHLFDMNALDPARPINDPVVLEALDQVVAFLTARLR